MAYSIGAVPEHKQRKELYATSAQHDTTWYYSILLLLLLLHGLSRYVGG